MSVQTYKKVELVGSSNTSIEDAVKTAVERANKTLRNLLWFEVVETRGQIGDSGITQWQVTIEVGFALEEEGG